MFSLNSRSPAEKEDYESMPVGEPPTDEPFRVVSSEGYRFKKDSRVWLHKSSAGRKSASISTSSENDSSQDLAILEENTNGRNKSDGIDVTKHAVKNDGETLPPNSYACLGGVSRTVKSKSSSPNSPRPGCGTPCASPCMLELNSPPHVMDERQVQTYPHSRESFQDEDDVEIKHALSCMAAIDTDDRRRYAELCRQKKRCRYISPSRRSCFKHGIERKGKLEEILEKRLKEYLLSPSTREPDLDKTPAEEERRGRKRSLSPDESWSVASGGLADDDSDGRMSDNDFLEIFADDNTRIPDEVVSICTRQPITIWLYIPVIISSRNVARFYHVILR